ncbi:hypothetical protein BGZ95_007806 [Linnemannia exigua]|uniref:Monopolin complex subunit Csm1/Pcs1 C-terminal domain-containing protein n=1 Tax=Linnemannia exigua TaxID=604196 RepID=A0AAD4HAQ4_9FUNG|nr:hypothetical protein BGZ95_007806 [Linnemannia exigua]
MSRKRVTMSKPAGAKRTKGTIYRNSESGSEDNSTGVHKPVVGKPTKRRAKLTTFSDSEDDDNDEDQFSYNALKPKQPQPRPRKKILYNSSTSADATTTSTSAAVPPPTTAKTTIIPTSILGGSSAKQKPQLTLADIANTLHKSSSYSSGININNSILKSSASVLKSRKDTSLVNQENIDSRRFKEDAAKSTKKPMRQQASSSMSLEELTTALEELKDKYRRLQQLRETDAERNLTECRAQLEENILSAANYRAKIEPQLESALRANEKLRENNEIANAKVRTLQRQVRDHEDTLKQRDQEEKIRAKTASMEAVLASPDVTPHTASAISSIKMYENLSGFKLVPRDIFPRSNKDKIPAVWDCEHSGPRGTLRFTLTYNYTTNIVTYVPNIDPKRDEKLLKNLPDYLMDEIEFDRESESKFFWRILNFNNEDDA